MARKPPWKKANPRKKAGKKSKKLAPAKKAAAKRKAKKAGRRYPSLVAPMQQQISVITLGIADLAASKRFYVGGFGWKPVFENEEVVFYQMNGLMLGTWLQPNLEDDAKRAMQRPGAFALAHNVASEDDVDRVIDVLAKAGGRVLRAADAPAHGGYRGYIADPDDHTWEIAFNPAWKIDVAGHVTFGV